MRYAFFQTNNAQKGAEKELPHHIGAAALLALLIYSSSTALLITSSGISTIVFPNLLAVNENLKLGVYGLPYSSSFL